MCDIGDFAALLATAGVLVAGAIAAIAVAAALNGGFFSAPGAVPAMVTASVLIQDIMQRITN